MQRIKHKYENVSPIFDDIERVYMQTSEKREGGLVPKKLDPCFKPLFDLFSVFGGVDYRNIYVKQKYAKIDDFERSKHNIIVCFSGGKDSIAAVLHYQKLGYNVYLYHMRRINFALSDEWKAVEEFAEYMKLPLYIEEINSTGYHDWVEHPMKNMIIANGALNYGIREKISTKIAFGNYYTGSVWDDNFGFCGGDDMEMWEAYETIIRRIIPKFRMYVCLKHIYSAMKLVCNRKDLLDISVSCIGRANLREYWHGWTENKFGIKLPKYRCGRCYKCCVEYIYMTDNGLAEYSEEYYKYCLKNLKKNMIKEGEQSDNILDVWDHYFFCFDINKSHALQFV